MKNKSLLVILTACGLSLTSEAQINLELNFVYQQKVYNPVPLRDSIPSALIKPSARQTITIIPARVDGPKVTSQSSIKSDSIKIHISDVKVLAQIPMPSGIDKKIYVSPKLLPTPIIKITSAGTAKIVMDVKNPPVVAQVKPLERIPSPQIIQDQLQIADLISISNDEYKMIHALLFFEVQKRYDSAMSLFIDLLNSEEFKLQAQFLYAEAAFKLNLYDEYKNKMLTFLKNKTGPYFKKKALESLLKNAVALKAEDVPAVENELNTQQVDVKASDYWWLKKAKYFSDQGDLKTAEQSLNQIPVNSKIIVQSRLLLSNVHYRQGNLNSALSVLEGVQDKVSSDRTDKFRNLLFLTLARLNFQKSNYKQSYAQYLKIDKSSGLWLQASTEQALTQILSKDYIGAAGNMFSLHTDYFKKAYAPESYIIRAVGYLNLCQYGDAVSVIAELQRRYTKIAEQVQSTKHNELKSADFYRLTRELFTQNDAQELQGLPRSFFIELVRHPSFIAVQKRINDAEEEVEKFNSVTKAMAAQSQRLKQQVTKLKNDLEFLRKNQNNLLLSEATERKILALESEISTNNSGREKIEKMKAAAAVRAAAEKNELKLVAGAAIKKQFGESKKTLVELLEQKDVLAYEIYSGAGEHLRYQMAGGEAKDRKPASALTPAEAQSYKWKFRGEVWEDEIGHYRSSLTDVCPKDDYAKHSGGE